MTCEYATLLQSMEAVGSSLRNAMSIAMEFFYASLLLSSICLQRSPSRRSTIKEVVGMLEPPHLPFEFSQSPPSIHRRRRRPGYLFNCKLIQIVLELAVIRLNGGASLRRVGISLFKCCNSSERDQYSMRERSFSGTKLPERNQKPTHGSTLPSVSSSCVNNLLPINLDKYNMDEEDHEQNQTSSQLNNENTKMKTMMKRRDIERQRRQEMTNLYALLRSLLPFEYIKGKRSISDHMNEATRYIKHLQKTIQLLTEKRDGLKRITMNSNNPTYDISRRTSFPHQQPDYVTIRLCWPGLEVVISNNLSTGGLALSRVLGVLVEEGFDIVSCASTRVNERSVHNIKSEVIGDPTRINTTELQQKLTNVVRYSNRIPMIMGTSTTTSYATIS